MNRAERRAIGITARLPILTVTQEQLDKYMPEVMDGDVVKIIRNGKESVWRVELNTGKQAESGDLQAVDCSGESK